MADEKEFDMGTIHPIDIGRYQTKSDVEVPTNLDYKSYVVKSGCKIEVTKETVNIYIPNKPIGTIYQFSRKEAQEALKEIIYTNL